MNNTLADWAVPGGVERVVAALLAQIKATDPSADGSLEYSPEWESIGVFPDEEEAERRYAARAPLVLRLVALALELGWSAGIGIDDQVDEVDGTEAWPVVYVVLPEFGQISFHLKPYPDPWDCHTTEEKYDRVAAFIAAHTRRTEA